MTIPVFIIDTFTSRAFSGNPTGVCLVDEMPTPEFMLSVANELNPPVSAFIESLPETGDYEIRYFTPATEIPACGHATLAAAQTALICKGDREAKFTTVGGVEIGTFSEPNFTRMNYPKYEMIERALEREILESLKIDDYKTGGVCPELETLFIEVADARILRSSAPDFVRLMQSNDEISEVVITSRSDVPEFDYLLRSFCPWIGIPEDPVTGSVHTVLAGFWRDRLGKKELIAYQASARGGELYVTAHDDRTELGGKTVLILKGEINL